MGPTYFDQYDDNFYYIFLHLNTALSVLSNVSASYFIFAHSPVSIGTYKWYLFNIVLCSFAFDVYTTLIYVPKPLYPALVTCTQGWLNQFGWLNGASVGYFFLNLLFGPPSLSILWAFVYRLTALHNKHNLIDSRKGWTVVLVTQSLYMLPSLLFYCLAIGDRSAIEQHVIQEFPSIQSHFVNKPCTAISFEVNSYALIYEVVLSVQLGILTPAAALLIYLCVKVLNENKGTMSEKTFRMQRQLICSLALQFAVPLCTLYTPFAAMLVLALCKVYYATFYQILFLLGTLRSVCNAALMVFTIRPYRHAFLAMLSRKWHSRIKLGRSSRVMSTYTIQDVQLN